MKPLEFAVFPTVLLVTTLLRLSLNVASTRVVLIDGHMGPGAAGKVIESFGHFVVGDSYAVGVVVFVILVVINFVVITKGAGRIAEVGARFTLDALPGKQMAIDADLNAGLIGEDEARQRRSLVTQEADFYGAMDGASKFVRGDAIAGILIMVINLIGGLVIGTLQHGMPIAVAAKNYSLLAIGDGLVAQIPALIISTAAGLVVSRVGSEENMGAAAREPDLRAPRGLRDHRAASSARWASCRACRTSRSSRSRRCSEAVAYYLLQQEGGAADRSRRTGHADAGRRNRPRSAGRTSSRSTCSAWKSAIASCRWSTVARMASCSAASRRSARSSRRTSASCRRRFTSATTWNCGRPPTASC